MGVPGGTQALAVPLVPPEWAYEAACAGGWAVFDRALPTFDEEVAKDLCAICPVFDQCRADIDQVERGTQYGGWADMVFAGELPGERHLRRIGMTIVQRRRGGLPPPAKRTRTHAYEPKPWQERAGSLRRVDPQSLPGWRAGFAIHQVIMLTGLTQKQVVWLAKSHGVGIPGGRSGRASVWSLADIDKLRAIKDLLDEGRSMQAARKAVL